MSSFGWFVVEKSHFPPVSTCKPLFFPPCFFDPRWQNPWNYVGGDKGPQRHVDTSGFTPDEKKAVAWISGSISTITDTSQLLWIPILRYDFIYIYAYVYIHTNLHTYIFLNHLHQWCLTSAFPLKEKTSLLKGNMGCAWDLMGNSTEMAEGNGPNSPKHVQNGPTEGWN